ncbi:MAG: hypothetical protein LBQ98_04175 [Nitrososphaerota archaeon]|jgi:hypothetical protein|nr:hypothetical protein [Nitrososphaerota archaeon]
MVKKALIAAVIVVITAVVVASGILLLTTPASAHITIVVSESISGVEHITDENRTSSCLAADSSYVGDVTYLIMYQNVTTTKTTQISLNDFDVTCDGQPLAVIERSSGVPIDLAADQMTEVILGLVVEGNQEGNFEVHYHGPSDVEIK